MPIFTAGETRFFPEVAIAQRFSFRKLSLFKRLIDVAFITS